MPGCTLLVAGIPDPLPKGPIFLYLDKNGNAVPPPNYVPGLDDCHDSGCSCGCSGSGAGGCGCGSVSGLNPACGGDPGAQQLDAVNDLLRQASHEFAVSTKPGWLEVWDGSTGN